MKKLTIISWIVKIVLGAAALGLGVWYLSSSVGGASVGYASLDNFMIAIGVGDGNIASANGCFLCGPVQSLFAIIGNAAEMFWTAMVQNLWILLAIGFGIYLFIHTANHISKGGDGLEKLDTSEKKFDFKEWFEPVRSQGIRIMIVGALLGALGFGGTTILRTITNITITPVMFAGSELAMAATDVADAATCVVDTVDNNDILNPVMRPFMCVIGNLNTVMLAGASGGFALMNYAWMDNMDGGAMTWIAGLALVIMFLVIGFDLFFQTLTIVFKLVFLIIFLPLLLAMAAFAKTWDLAQNVIPNAIKMLVDSAIRIVIISLKTFIIFAIVQFAADEYFPGPNDGYTSILPPLIERDKKQEIKDKNLAVMDVFSTCEQVAMGDAGVDKDKFKNCFTAQRAMVEREHPGAFDFMRNGWEFLLMMIGIFIVYFWLVNPKVDEMLGGSEESKDKGELFNFGGWLKDLGKTIYDAPSKIIGQFGKGKG